MTKEAFIKSLDEIVYDEILITTDPALLDKEVAQNFWSIAIDQELSEQLNIDDLDRVIKRIIQNRRAQLIHSDLNVGLIFYLWYDEQASQLRFNLINSNHQQLPFKASIKFVASAQFILEQFLGSKYHDGIPFDELQDIDSEDDFSEDEKKYQVIVFKQLITKS